MDAPNNDMTQKLRPNGLPNCEFCTADLYSDIMVHWKKVHLSRYYNRIHGKIVTFKSYYLMH